MMKYCYILLVCALAIQAQEAPVNSAGRTSSLRSTATRTVGPNQTTGASRSASPTNDPNETGESTASGEESLEQSATKSDSTTTSTSTQNGAAATLVPLPVVADSPSSGEINRITGTIFIYTGLLLGYYSS